MARTKQTARRTGLGPNQSSLPRLPSGIYFSLLADAAAAEANHAPEYPTFPSYRGAEGGRDSGTGSVAPPGIGGTTDLPYRPAAPTPPQPQLCLPLVSVFIDMQVNGSMAKTKVVQTFTNHGRTSIPEAWYSFPLYDGATITAFRCEVGNDKVLEGKVKPKEEARQEFQRAVQKQEAAALVEELTPEVFQTTIGNIAPGTTIRVEITYVEELHADLGGDGVLVTIPTSVAPRYGEPPAGYKGKSTTLKEPRLSVVVSVASSSAEKPIVCRSGHSINVKYEEVGEGSEDASFEDVAAPESQPGTDTNSQRATVRMYPKTAMDRDIIMFVPWPNNNIRRSQAQLAVSNDLDHSALMVTVRPSELFSVLRESMSEFDGEVLFLADRSGSMGGPKMEELRNALFVFVKSLPPKCRFNLYSFGSDVSGLWDSSAPYSESTVQYALDHISTFQADFGGTEVLRALKKAVDDRQMAEASSTQVILLTDGETWRAHETIEYVRMNAAKADGQLRFFSLGLGNQASHQLIQGLGLAGGGFGEVVAVGAAGRWKEAVIRILKGAIMPNSWSYSISIDGQWDEKRLDVDNVSLRHAERSSHPFLVQAPRKIPLLHHYGQHSVYFLMDTSTAKLPEQVTITASSQYGGTKTATLKVTKAALDNTTIHHLAARAVVRDLESQDVPDALSSDIIRSNAEHLCQTYSITSKWASFVAVSHLQEQESVEDGYVEVSLYTAPRAEGDLWKIWHGGKQSQLGAGIAPRKQLASKAARKSAPTPAAPVKVLASKAARKSAPTACAKPAVKRAKRMPGAPAGDGVGPAVFDLDYVDPVTSSQPPENPYEIPWQDIIRFQRIDGLFDLEKSVADRLAKHFCPGTQQALGRWVEKHASDDAAKGSDSVGLLTITVMVLAYLRSHFYQQRALWELLVQKAEGRIASRLQAGQWDRPDGLSALADSALAHAHYGRRSQNGAGEDWWKSGSDGGHCGVCDAQRPGDDGPSTCFCVGCDVSVSPWDTFWSHVIAQGHINSSCKAADGWYEAAQRQPEQGGRRRSQRIRMAKGV